MDVLIVGFGSIGQKEVSELTEHPSIQLVGVAERDPTRRCSVPTDICPTFDSLTAALNAVDPSLVRIATPPRTHHDLAIEALEFGCDVYIEKIMTTEASTARDIVDTAAQLGQSVFVRRNAIYTPVYQRAWNDHLPEIGTVRHVHWTEPVGRYTDWSQSKREWLRELPGGIVSEHLPHALYTVRWFLGAEPTVESVQFSGEELHVSLTTESAQARISYVRPTDLPMLLDVTGSDGSMRINHSTMQVERPRGFEDASTVEARTTRANVQDLIGTVRNVTRLATHLFRRELDVCPDPLYSQSDNYRQFTDIAERGGASGAFSIDGQEGVKNVELFEEIWRQAE